jgi:hypothetical protein
LQARLDVVYEYSYIEGLSQAVKSLVLFYATSRVAPFIGAACRVRCAVLDGMRLTNLDSWSHAQRRYRPSTEHPVL